MYLFAVTVMNNTSLPIEMCFFDDGYAYPDIRVGYSSTQLCTCINYSWFTETAWDGTKYMICRATGFKWAFALDDYSVYQDLE